MIILVFTILAFVLMEGAAWSAHKYLMHGFLWKVHEDHHRPTGKPFQWNDLFFLIFAIPSWLCMMFGIMYSFDALLGFGIGIAVYGVVYFLVHDVLIHRRFKWFDKTNIHYFKAIRKAHKVHHKKMGKEDGECFGMLIVPKKYLKK